MLQGHIAQSLAPPGPLRIEITSIDSGPVLGKARKVVARVWEPTGDLTWVWRTIDAAAVSAGFARDGDRFLPHVTLGRIQPPQRITTVELQSAVFAVEFPAAFATSEIALIRSEVTPHGSAHSRVGVIRLPEGSRPALPSADW